MDNQEAEVVIVGYGGAGASAAITAHDAGASVLILEKNPEGGGNTQYSGGTIREYLDLENATTYFENILYGSVDRQMIKTFVAESMRNPDWLRAMGAELVRANVAEFPPSHHVIWPHLPGASGVGGRWHVKGEMGASHGGSVWGILCKNVEQRKIRVIYDSRAKHLIRDANKEVTGLIADTPNGEITVKASRAIILTCGGFQCNNEMQAQFLAFQYKALGNPGNTGDGIKMAIEIGADLWHMTGLSCTVGYTVPGIESPVNQIMPSGGFIYVDQKGERFVDEAGTDIHAFNLYFSHIDFKSLTYPRMPSYTIFDDDTRRSGTIAATGDMLMGRWTNFHNWSSDNMLEIEKGWIKKGDSIEELALKIGVRSDVLQETVSDYNMFCVGGYDKDFNRPPDTLVPIVRPPFYAIASEPVLINTQGGPKRNARAQVMDINGQPIKRLYSAGELGSIWGVNYPGGGNITESLSFGRIAGRNAAAEKPLN
jgi:succinate dehydrogenase/fumarate reductase flavoprotein subunit